MKKLIVASITATTMALGVGTAVAAPDGTQRAAVQAVRKGAVKTAAEAVDHLVFYFF